MRTVALNLTEKLKVAVSKEQNAAHALQHLTLESGGFDAPFKAQVQALDNIRYLIHT